MDPVLIAAIGSAVGAAATAAGTDAWRGLLGLVDRVTPDRRDRSEPLGRDETEALTALLVERADRDPGFRAELDDWLRAASGPAGVHNVIGGSARVHGPALQGRSFHGTFNFGTPNVAPDDAEDRPPPG